MRKKSITIIAIILGVCILAAISALAYFRLNPYYGKISITEVSLGDVEVNPPTKVSIYINIKNKYICFLKGGRWGKLTQCGFAGCETSDICSPEK